MYKNDYSGQSFAGQYLDEYNFSNYNLAGCIFTGAYISSCVFDNANLTDADFGGASIYGNTSFDEATLCKANFATAKLTDVSFDYANLTQADLRGVDLSQTSLFNANMAQAKLTSTRQLPAMYWVANHLPTVHFDNELEYPYNTFVSDVICAWLAVECKQITEMVNGIVIGATPYQVKVTVVHDGDDVYADINISHNNVYVFGITTQKGRPIWEMEDLLLAIFGMADMFDVLDPSQVAMMVSRLVDVTTLLRKER